VHQITLEVGGIACRFEFNRNDIAEDIRERYGAFIVDGTRPAVEFRVDLVDELNGIVAEQMAGLQPGAPEMIFENGHIRYGRIEFTVDLEWDEGRAHARMLPNIYTFDAIYRIFYSICTVKLGGVFLHAASLIRNEKGYIFTGITDSGKSEISEMGKKDSIHLTDELSVILPVDGQFQTFGTPFWGLFATGGANRGVAVEKLFFLVRDEKTFEAPLTPAGALPRFMRNILNFASDPGFNTQLFLNASQLLQSIYFSELHSVPDPSIWPLVDSPVKTA
jgi:hypothetical protein